MQWHEHLLGDQLDLHLLSCLDLLSLGDLSLFGLLLLQDGLLVFQCQHKIL